MQTQVSKLLQITTVKLTAVLILSCFVGTTSFASGQTTNYSTQSEGSSSAISVLESKIEANGGWNSSLQTIYDGIVLGKTTVAQLQQAVDSINVSSTSAAESVFYWYIQLNKLGVSINSTTIEAALDAVTMLPNIGGLPFDYLNGETASFMVYNRYVLNAYQWAEQLNYQTSKWNISEAYAVFNDSVTAYGKPVLCVGSNGVGWGIKYGPRYYDECAQTIDMYLNFWLLGIEDGLTQAKHWWNWENANLWVNSSSGSFYKYANKWNTFECEAGAFDQIIWKFYQYDSSIPNVENLFVDMETRALSNGWNSPQWADYVVVHATENSQQRLENTINSWAAMLGFYGNLTSDMQNKIQALLDGSTGPAPAWNLIMQSKLYDETTGMFKMLSDTSVSTEATADAAVLLMQLSTVPVTGALAVPLQDYRYQDINNIIDGGVSSLNLETHTLTLSVSKPGTFLSMLGTNIFEYNLNNIGVWQVNFADDWNNINSKTLVSELPNRSYLGNTETAEPFPAPTPTPSPTTSPTPTATPIPSPTPTVEPTATPKPTLTPPSTPTASPKITPTPTATPTSIPTQIVAPTDSTSLENNTSQPQTIIIVLLSVLAITSLTILVILGFKKNLVAKEKE